MNLAFMKKQFAFAEGFVIPRAAGHILGDVGVDEERAAGLEIHVGVANVGFAFAESFHFGAVKDEACFHPFEDVVVEGGGAILRDDLFARLFGVLALLGALLGALPGLLSWPSHNLSFYLMKRLIRMSGRAAQPDEHIPSRRRPDWGKAGELADATV